MLDEKRIKELQRMTKKELIEIIDKLESEKYFLNKEKETYKDRYEREEQRRKETYEDMVRYREERAELRDKPYLKEDKFYIEEAKKLAKQSYKHNERGAGRKNKFNAEQIQQIQEARAEGKSIRSIANEFSCSVGLVHKLINEK